MGAAALLCPQLRLEGLLAGDKQQLGRRPLLLCSEAEALALELPSGAWLLLRRE